MEKLLKTASPRTNHGTEPLPDGGDTNHGHAVVQQRLPEHHDEENLVDVDLLEHRDDGDGVHRCDQAAEEKVLQQANVQVAYAAGHTGRDSPRTWDLLPAPSQRLTHGSAHVTPPQRQPHTGGVPAGTDDGVDQNRPHVAEEELVGHGVTGVQDDLWQQVEEEDHGGQLEGLHLVCAPNYPAQEEAQADEQGALRDDAGHVVVGLDDWGEDKDVRPLTDDLLTTKP